MKRETKEKLNGLGCLILLLVFVIVIGVLISCGVDYLLEPVDLQTINGEITAISISDSTTLYVINNESYSLRGLPIDNVLLNTQCQIIYGYTQIWHLEKFISLEYLEVE